MRKNKLDLCLKVGLMALCVINIFSAFFPMISFQLDFAGRSLVYSLDGMSLLVNHSKAMYWDMYDVIVLDGVEFSKSSTFISAFSLNVVILFLCGFTMFIKSKFDLDKFVFPLISILGVVNIVCSSMVLSNFDTLGYHFFIDYGLILFILFASLEFIISLSISIIIFKPHKNLKD